MLKCQSFATLNLAPEKLKNLCNQVMRESYGI